MKTNFPDDDNFEFNFEEEPTFPDDKKEKVTKFVDELPLLTPREIFDELETRGYKGQDEQRRAVSLMAYRHVRRLKRIHVEGVDADFTWHAVPWKCCAS